MLCNERNNRRNILALLIMYFVSTMCTLLYECRLLGKVASVEASEYNGEQELKIEAVEYNGEPETKGEVVENSLNGGQEVMNIVLLGIDSRGFSGNIRSDSIIIVSLDRKNNNIKLTSIMRDTYVHIPGRDMEKLGHAYAYGGSKLAMETINKNFDMDIENFITIDFTGFEKVIDAIGGIEIELSPDEASYLNVDDCGKQLLDGEKALEYSRIRMMGNGDYERTERQRRVLVEVFKKIIAMNAIKYPKLLNIFLPLVKTNISRVQALSLATETIKSGIKNVEQFRIPADGYAEDKKINRTFYVVPNTMEDNIMLLKDFIYGNPCEANQSQPHSPPVSTALSVAPRPTWFPCYAASQVCKISINVRILRDLSQLLSYL
jgi:LCP family protein required for cell wall assembly